MTTKSILQEWVTQMGLRHQGVLLTVVRGFDSWPKHCPEKPLIREMRGLILVPFDPRELQFPNGFMSAFPHPQADEAFKAFCDNIDGLTVHYVMHVVHACEIFGYAIPTKRSVGLTAFAIQNWRTSSTCGQSGRTKWSGASPTTVWPPRPVES